VRVVSVCEKSTDGRKLLRFPLVGGSYSTYPKDPKLRCGGLREDGNEDEDDNKRSL